MLSRTLAAEFFKCSRRWALLFWGFAFVPVCALVVGIALQLNTLHVPGADSHIDVLSRLVQALELSGSPFCQVFFIASAAVIFAGEYDSHTWRLLMSRAPRKQFMLAKVAVYASGVFASLLLLLVGAGICVLLASVRLRAPLLWQLAGSSPSLALCLQFSISALELLLVGLLTGLIAVVFRSLFVGALVVIFLTFCQAILASVVSMRMASPFSFVALPPFCVEVLRFYAAHREFAPARYVGVAQAGAALLSMLSWVAAAAWLTLTYFQRQQLERE
jgi:ABC-type transport system involved in multi-copper enzyme maturation permease subunit